MPIYEYENTRTGERFEKLLPISERDYPCKAPNVRRVISAPHLSLISDVGGREDKAREQILKSAEEGYQERDLKEKLGMTKTPDWAKEKREKKKQKRQWL